MSKAAVLEVAKSYLGTQEHDERHKEIIRIYNNHKPLARGYAINEYDAWCMAFVSVCFVKAGEVPAIGKTECGCQDYIDYAKSSGKNIVNDPKAGDLIFYGWSSKYHANHVGIITGRNNRTLTVIEGNKSDSVGYRSIDFESESIICFIRPDYSDGNGDYKPGKLSYADSYSPEINGLYEVTAEDFLALRYNPFVSETNLITEMPPAARVRNYGYYTGDWYLVIYNGITGFCHKNWLRRI